MERFSFSSFFSSFFFVYSEKGNVVEVFGLYLTSYTSGKCFIPRPPGQPKGEWDAKEYNDKKSLIANCSIREICSIVKNFTHWKLKKNL